MCPGKSGHRDRSSLDAVAEFVTAGFDVQYGGIIDWDLYDPVDYKKGWYEKGLRLAEKGAREEKRRKMDEGRGTMEDKDQRIKGKKKVISNFTQ